MKRIFALMLTILLCLSFIVFQGCNNTNCKSNSKPIDLTVDNINDYIIINVVEDETQYEFVGSYKHFYKNINIITSSKLDAKYKNLKITFDLEPSVSQWVSQSDEFIEVSYTGESETQFHVSSEISKGGYISSTPEYKVIITKVEGQIIIE